MKAAWEDPFERRYGFWRGILDGTVHRGFAAFLRDEVVADVGHAQWVFAVPDFMHYRRLLGPLCTAAWPTVRDLMAVAAGDDQSFPLSMVDVVQTSARSLRLTEGPKLLTAPASR